MYQMLGKHNSVQNAYNHFEKWATSDNSMMLFYSTTKCAWFETWSMYSEWQYSKTSTTINVKAVSIEHHVWKLRVFTMSDVYDFT